MKYGNISQSAPDYTDDFAALKDLLGKGEITKSEYTKRFEDLRKSRLSYIVLTNGGYSISKKAQGNLKYRLQDLKTRHIAQKALENREQLLKEETPEKSEATVESA